MVVLGLENKNKHDFGTSEFFPSEIYLISLSKSTHFLLINYKLLREGSDQIEYFKLDQKS